MAVTLSQKLGQDKRRFALWRQRRKQRGPIPEELWEVAVGYVPELGVNRVSREFRLNHTQLKRKAQARGQQPAAVRPAGPAFVELGWPEAVGSRSPSGPVRLVLERADGARLCVEGPGADRVLLEGLMKDFCRS